MHSGCNRACVAVWCPRLDVCCGIAAALHPFQASISRLASGHHDGTRACAAPRNIVPASWGPPPTTVWQGSRASEPTHQVDTVARWNSASADPFPFTSHRGTSNRWLGTPHTVRRRTVLSRQPDPTRFTQQMSAWIPRRILHLSAALDSANPCAITSLHRLHRTCQEAQCSTSSGRLSTLQSVMHLQTIRLLRWQPGTHLGTSAVSSLR